MINCQITNDGNGEQPENNENGLLSPLAQRAIQYAKNLISEWADAAVIIASSCENGHTRFVCTTFGNKFTVDGMINKLASIIEMNDEIQNSEEAE